jgi:hypothetical protein
VAGARNLSEVPDFKEATEQARHTVANIENVFRMLGEFYVIKFRCVRQISSLMKFAVVASPRMTSGFALEIPCEASVDVFGHNARSCFLLQFLGASSGVRMTLFVGSP